MLGDNEDLLAKGVVSMVEDALRVEGLSPDARLEMQMVGRCSACTPFQPYGVAGMKPLPHSDKVAGMVTVECLQAVGMTQDDAITIAVMGARQDDFARKSCTCGIAGKGLDVGPSMMASTTIRTEELSSGKRIAPLFLGIVGKIDGELVAMGKGVFRSLHLHHLPLVDVWSLVLSIQEEDKGR